MLDRILVLIAEDDEVIRLLVAETLRDVGLEVMEAEDAEAALSVLKHHAARIHVLFTDIHMPGSLDGVVLLITLRKAGLRSRCLSPRRVPSRMLPRSRRSAASWQSHTDIHKLSSTFASS